MNRAGRKQKKKRLRSGFTTGTAAAAAAKAALIGLLEKAAPERVTVMLLTGDAIEIDIHRWEKTGPRSARATVIKDAGDDPDATHRAEIGARVTLLAGNQSCTVSITGGIGVGRVTKPGLEVSPGSAAINPGPQKIIRESIAEVLAGKKRSAAVAVEVFVPEGERIAGKTLNARLGIVGGISILGTTGIVRPMSHEAYTATIFSALSVAEACGVSAPVLTTGRRSERFAQALWPEQKEEAFVQIGDYFKVSLQRVGRMGFSAVRLAVFFGKAVKMAQGIGHTHAAKSELLLERLAGWVRDAGGDAGVCEGVAAANTAREAFLILEGRCPEAIAMVGRKVTASAAAFAVRPLTVRAVIFDYLGSPAFDSGQSEKGART